MQAVDRPEDVQDFTEFGSIWGYGPAACKFLNFVVAKYSLPSEIFERQDDEHEIFEELKDYMWDGPYDDPVPFIQKEKRSLLSPGEEKLYAEYSILMKVIQEFLRQRQRFGDYRKNANNKLVQRFKVVRDIGPNEQLKRFHKEWERLIQLPVMQSMISAHLHDERLSLACLKGSLLELHERLKVPHEDVTSDNFVYKDTPIDQRGGYPAPKKPTDPTQLEWDTWDGSAVHY